jgi:deoxyribonuclease-4
LQQFADLREAAGIDPCVIHTPYLINLASDDPKKYDGSIALLRADLAAAAAGRIRYVNTHLGSYGDRDRNEGFARICSALETVLADIAPGVFLVLENSAGAGNLAGGRLDELGRFLDALDHPQLGVCLDTAHAWAAGYRIDSRAGVDDFLAEAAACIGLERVHMFHFNDTEVELGASRDRHWHIGEGKIGFDGFRALLARPELREKTAILETPGDDADDLRNMQTVLALANAVT